MLLYKLSEGNCVQSILSQLKPGGVPYAASQCGIERRRINQIAKEKNVSAQTNKKDPKETNHTTKKGRGKQMRMKTISAKKCTQKNQ